MSASTTKAAPRGNFLGSRRAVTAGFEPAVGLPTLAFEASSFGRSDTSPPRNLSSFRPRMPIHLRSLAMPGEEVQERRGALVGANAADDLDAMVQAGVSDDIEEGGDGAGLGVVRSKDDPIDPR